MYHVGIKLNPFVLNPVLMYMFTYIINKGTDYVDMSRAQKQLELPLYSLNRVKISFWEYRLLQESAL